MFAKLFQILMTPADSPKNKTREILHRKWNQKSRRKWNKINYVEIVANYLALCFFVLSESRLNH